LYGGVGRVKKFSGLQVMILKKLFTIKTHPLGAALARIASSILWLVCACQGCPQ